jgi:uncharacterized protein (DUF58 family)
MVPELYQRRASSLFVTSLVLVLVGLVLFAALLNGARNLTILCLLLFVVAGGLKLWSSLAVRKSVYTFSVDRRRLFAGEEVTSSLRIANNGILPLSAESHVPPGTFLNPDGGSLDGEVGLLPYQSALLSWTLTVPHRGVHSLGPLTVAVGDVFGFFARQISRRDEIEIVAYPKLVNLRSFSVPRRDFFGIPGGESPVDDPVYILGTIDYQYGRPAKHIHWKASARHHRLQQKVFEPTEQEKALLIVDSDSFDQEEDAFERTLEIVGSLAAQLDRRGCAVGFATNALVNRGSSIIPVTRSPAQIQAILDTLARMSPKSGSSMIDTLPAVRTPWGTSCLYFCLRSTANTNMARGQLSRYRLPVILLPYEDAVQLREDSHKDGSGPTYLHEPSPRVSIQ